MGLFLPAFVSAVVIEDDTYCGCGSCSLYQKPTSPQNPEYSIGSIDGKPIIMIDWKAAENLNLENSNESEYSNVSYIINKINGDDTVSVVYDTTKIDNLNVGGFLIDESVEWNKSYVYKIYAYDTVNNIESDPAILTVDVIPALDDQEDECSDALGLQAELEKLDEETNIVKLSWDQYCGEGNDFIVYRKQVGQDNEETLINITDSSANDYYNEETGRIEYMDKTVSQDVDNGDVEYEYRVEVWGPKDDTSTSLKRILIPKAFAAEKEKKIEETVKIKMDGTTSSPSPSATEGLLPDSSNPGLPSMTLTQIIQTIIKVIIAIAQVLLVIMLLIGGFMYLTSAGNEEQASKARNLIFWAIIGILIVWSAWAIANFAINMLK